MQSQLFIRPTYETLDSDAYWLFGLALTGRFYFVPSCHCKKRFYPTSTSARWGPRRNRHRLSAGIILCSYLKDFAVSRREACYGMILVALWSLLRMIGTSPRRSSLRLFLERVLLRV